MLHIDANIPITIEGTPTVVYDKVYIRNLQITSVLGAYVTATVEFRLYRILEDGGFQEAPLENGSRYLTIENLNAVLDVVEGGSQLKDGVEAAFIGLAKMKGVI